MGNTTYRDLAEFGLRLVPPAQPDFASLVRDIESRPEPFQSWPVDDLGNAAVLLNESNLAILGISYLWRYTAAAGEAFTHHHSNLGSSTQLEVLAGRSEVVQDLGTFILRGSKRLITERGMFGNNLDVLGREMRFCGGGYMGAGGGRGGPGRREETVAAELVLDLAILEDGRCVGSDETGLFDSLVEDLDRIHRTARQAAAALRSGAAPGELFEMLRPLARPTRSHAQPGSRSPFLGMFGNMSIHRLVNDDPAAMASWLEGYAQPPRLRLHRVS